MFIAIKISKILIINDLNKDIDFKFFTFNN